MALCHHYGQCQLGYAFPKIKIYIYTYKKKNKKQEANITYITCYESFKTFENVKKQWQIKLSFNVPSGIFFPQSSTFSPQRRTE